MTLHPTDHTRPTDEVMAAVAAATTLLVRTVDGLSDDDLAAPSLLPGWTRADVVAHLALNAEALAGVLTGAAAGTPVAMYASAAARDEAIAELATFSEADSVPALRARLLGSTTLFADAIALVRPEQWGGEVERTPGAPGFPLVAVPAARLVEVEVHHVDLGVGYSGADWAGDFAERLIDLRASRQAWAGPVRLLARDLARTWEIGTSQIGTPVSVTGEAHELAWWLTGRGDGATLSVDGGEIPVVAAW